MNYKGEIIHFFGGLQPYIGRLDTNEHPNGPGWYRIIDPCEVAQRVDKEGRAHGVISRIWGVQKNYRHYVDVYCPEDSLKEIRVLDKNGEMYNIYQQELKAVGLNKIVAPTMADVESVNQVGREH